MQIATFPEHSSTATLENAETSMYDSNSDQENVPRKPESQSNYIKPLIFATHFDRLQNMNPLVILQLCVGQTVWDFQKHLNGA